MYHNGNNAFKSARNEYQDVGLGLPKKVSENFDSVVESLKLEYDVDQTLRALKKSQEWEYNIAKERLCEQMSYIQNLFQRLDKEKSEIARHIPYLKNPDALLQITENRVDQIKKELLKLEDMKAVSKGFTKTSKEILKQHFGLEM